MIATAEQTITQPQLTFFDLPVNPIQTRFDKQVATRKRNTCQRNERIRDRFNYLYNVERKRIDDVIDTLCKEWNLEKTTIERALKS